MSNASNANELADKIEKLVNEYLMECDITTEYTIRTESGGPKWLELEMRVEGRTLID